MESGERGPLPLFLLPSASVRGPVKNHQEEETPAELDHVLVHLMGDEGAVLLFLPPSEMYPGQPTISKSTTNVRATTRTQMSEVLPSDTAAGS